MSLLARVLFSVVISFLLVEKASTEPTRVIKLVVPFPAGGALDIMSRLLAEQISHTQGVSMIVENRPGAAGLIGTEAVSRAIPDGNTALAVASGFTIIPHVRQVSYNVLTSFEPVCQVVRLAQVIVVNSASPYRTLPELFDAARAKPGELTLASVGPASSQQVGFEKLKGLSGVNITYIPYPGDAPAINALLGSHVTAMYVNYPAVAEHIRNGTLRAVATTSATRIVSLPNVPTVAEQGFQGYAVDNWFGVVVPAKSPADAVLKLGNWLVAATRDPDVARKFDALGLLPVEICGSEFAAMIREQYDDNGRTIREAHIKGD